MPTPPRFQARLRRHRRIRSELRGTATRPRLAVFRSLRYIQAQLIDDRAGRTLASATDRELTKATGTKMDRAKAVGQLLATKAKALKVTQVVFDRGGHRYHGRVRALAEGARAGGLTF